MKLGVFFNSHTNNLEILHGGNVFGHTALKNDFLVLDYIIIIIIIIHLVPSCLILILFLIQFNGMLDLDILAKIG